MDLKEPIKNLEDIRQLLPGTAGEYLGIELVQGDENGLSLRLEITPATRQPFGLLHGGVSLLLAETAASMHSCWGVDLTQVVPVGIEVSASHLRSATEGHILAKARVVRKSRSLAVHQVDIFHEASSQHLSTVRVTNFYKRLAD
jgi:1,4-dihydroxy-2-naphthoyl-CoA hydrolase